MTSQKVADTNWTWGLLWILSSLLRFICRAPLFWTCPTSFCYFYFLDLVASFSSDASLEGRAGGSAEQARQIQVLCLKPLFCACSPELLTSVSTRRTLFFSFPVYMNGTCERCMLSLYLLLTSYNFHSKLKIECNIRMKHFLERKHIQIERWCNGLQPKHSQIWAHNS